jgi:hypothetical protein
MPHADNWKEGSSNDLSVRQFASVFSSGADLQVLSVSRSIFRPWQTLSGSILDIHPPVYYRIRIVPHVRSGEPALTWLGTSADYGTLPAVEDGFLFAGVASYAGQVFGRNRRARRRHFSDRLPDG